MIVRAEDVPEEIRAEDHEKARNSTLANLDAFVRVERAGMEGGVACGEALAWKVVVQMREPNLVSAADRTVCEVSHERYEGITQGDQVFCHWR